jgi:hypothetical protein
MHVNRTNIATMLDKHLDEVETAASYGMEKRAVAFVLFNFSSAFQKDLNHAVTARVYGVLERRAPS